MNSNNTRNFSAEERNANQQESTTINTRMSKFDLKILKLSRQQVPTTTTKMGPKVWMLFCIIGITLTLNLCYVANVAKAQQHNLNINNNGQQTTTATTATTPTITTTASQTRAISEKPRSQVVNERKDKEDILSRRQGGHLTSRNGHHLVSTNLPPLELTDDSMDGGELFVNEDGSLETTGPSVVADHTQNHPHHHLLLDPGSHHPSSPGSSGSFPVAEYEADASSSTDLIELPPNMQTITPAQLQQATQSHNLRLLRQSAAPQSSTRFNLDTQTAAAAAASATTRGQQQQRQPQMMTMMTTQQTPRAQQQQNLNLNGRQQNLNLLPINSVVTTMMSTPRNNMQNNNNNNNNQQQQQQLQLQMAMNNIAPRGFQQQAAAQASQRAYDQQQLAPQQQVANTFNVNMGADRMLIKPTQNSQMPYSTSTTTATTEAARTNNAISSPSPLLLDQEMVTESINHELLTRANGSPLAGAQVDHGGHLASHQDLLYPANNNNNLNKEQHDLLYGQQQQQQQQQSSRLSPHHMHQPMAISQTLPDTHYRELAASTNQAICYTPVALLIVILVTMLVTVVVCFATHFVIKHLNRHQFDLIANRKHFDTRHGNGFLKGEAADEIGRRAPNSAAAIMGQADVNGSGSSNSTGNSGRPFQPKGQKHFSILGSSYYQQQRQRHEPAGRLAPFPVAGGGQMRDELGNYAFDNPYFRDEPTSMIANQASAGCLRQQQTETTSRSQQQQQQQQANIGGADNNRRLGQAGNLSTTTATTEATNNNIRKPGDSVGNDQLNFIEHHISNLHNKQVTSSVKELSILGSTSSSHEVATNPTYLGQHVVDLTSEEQRSRVIADPKEGDLIAVDLSGHDFIGLGFDVCGNDKEGIFVRSVLSRGPARESGCVHPGDRIKCLNISFDNITLQDACDILNCGSPYKLRLLLEKRALPAKLIAEKQRQIQPIIRRFPLANNLIGCNQMIAEQQAKNESNSAFAATKSYLRRLASLIVPNSSGNNTNGHTNGSQHHPAHHGHLGALQNYRDQFGVATPAFHTGSEHQLLDHHLQASSYLLGSSATRRPRTSMIGNPIFPPLDHSHINTGYGSDGDETGDELALASAVAAASATTTNSNNNNNNNSNAITNGGHLRRLSSRDSIDGISNLNHDNMMRSRFSVNSADTNDFGADSSLDYQNRNANHRLHGPPYNEQDRQRQMGDRLRLASQEAMGNSGKVASRHHQKSSSSRGASFNEQHHLEQTQSQPEIAHHRATASNLAITDELGIAESHAHHHQQANQRNGNRSQMTMMNSMSTPAMNLLINSSYIRRQRQPDLETEQEPEKQQQQQQDQADWRVSQQGKQGLRNDSKDKNASIREEAGSESSYGDSTSKLVDGKMKITNSTNTGKDSDGSIIKKDSSNRDKTDHQR